MDRIVLVTYGFNQGGTDRVAWQIAGGLANAGHDVTLLSCTSAGTLDTQVRKIIPSTVKLIALSRKDWKGRLLGEIVTFLKWRRWLRTHRPDVVLSTGNNINWYTALGVMTLRMPRPRFFLKTTNPIIRKKDGPFVRTGRTKIYGMLFRASDGVLTLSDAETRLLQSQFPKARDRFVTVDNAYLTAEFEAVSANSHQGASQGKLYLLAVGRMTAQKNFKRLLRSFALALSESRAREHACLRIAGDGPDRPALEALAAYLGIADKVEFLGYTSNIAELMAQSHLFILSSDYEGLPAVVIEALACDCPVIATDCFPNAKELLSSLPGCAVTMCTDDALANAMVKGMDEQSNAPYARPALRSHALRYSTAASVRSHSRAMSALSSRNTLPHAV